MKKAIPKQWFPAVPVALFIVGSLWALGITYFVYLPTFSGVTVHREDRAAIAQLYTVATNAFFIALTSGLVLGICVPAAYRWGRNRRRELRETRGAEPGAAPDAGSAGTPPAPVS